MGQMDQMPSVEVPPLSCDDCYTGRTAQTSTVMLRKGPDQPFEGVDDPVCYVFFYNVA